MNRLVLIAGVLPILVAATAARAQAPAADSAAAAEVRQAMAGYREAILRGDDAELDRFWSEDYQFVNPRGEALTKEQRLENIRSGGTQLTAIEEHGQPEIRTFGDVALAMGRVRLEGTYSGEQTSDEYRSLQVWAKRDGRWQLVAGQLTPVE